MYKYKKIFIVFTSIIYVLLTIIELIKYLKVDSNLYGVLYLVLSLIIIFFLVTVTYNYKRSYSATRTSKLIIIVVLGLFNSFLLNKILIVSMSYFDSSSVMIDEIGFIKNIIKPIMYLFVAAFTFFEIKKINLKK